MKNKIILVNIFIVMCFLFGCGVDDSKIKKSPNSTSSETNISTRKLNNTGKMFLSTGTSGKDYELKTAIWSAEIDNRVEPYIKQKICLYNEWADSDFMNNEMGGMITPTKPSGRVCFTINEPMSDDFPVDGAEVDEKKVGAYTSKFPNNKGIRVFWEKYYRSESIKSHIEPLKPATYEMSTDQNEPYSVSNVVVEMWLNSLFSRCDFTPSTDNGSVVINYMGRDGIEGEINLSGFSKIGGSACKAKGDFSLKFKKVGA